MNGILYDIDEIPAELRSYFEQVEAECGAPWERITSGGEWFGRAPSATKFDRTMQAGPLSGSRQAYRAQGLEGPLPKETTGWQPTCSHVADAVPCVVLDPFAGSGTTLAVAKQLGRRSIGIELSEAYCALAVKRIGAVTLPMAGLAG